MSAKKINELHGKDLQDAIRITAFALANNILLELAEPLSTILNHECKHMSRIGRERTLLRKYRQLVLDYAIMTERQYERHSAGSMAIVMDSPIPQ